MQKSNEIIKKNNPINEKDFQERLSKIVKKDKNGNQYVYARKLYTVLGYTNWRNFVKLINKIKDKISSNQFDASIKQITTANNPIQLELELTIL